MDDFQKEVEALKNQEENKEAQEDTEIEKSQEEQEAEEQDNSEEDTQDTQEPETVETEEDKLKKQEAYRERQKQKQDEQRRRQEELQKKSEDTTQNFTKSEEKELEDLKRDMHQIIQQQRIEQAIKSAERELEELEGDFREAFTDYDEKVNNALELTKLNLKKNGMTDSQADDYLRREKVLIADRAAAQGKDPVEAVYQEAQKVLSVFDEYAEMRGYKLSDDKPKTNLQKMREINKPNPMTGGTGRGATAAKTEFDDLGDDDLETIQNTRIWDVK